MAILVKKNKVIGQVEEELCLFFLSFFKTIFKIDGWHLIFLFSKFDGPIICTVENEIPKY